jgi:molybdenum cofactor cytidylyltransferase
MTLHTPPITGILLAAGRGTRFSPDGSSDKLLAPLPDGTEVAVASLRLLQSVSDRVIAVVRPHAEPLAARLAAEGAVVLPYLGAAEGIGNSLACAARASLDRPGPVMVALADMPWIRAETFRQLAALLSFNAIVAPVFEGRRGHPVGFAAGLLPMLARLSGDFGARELLQSEHVFGMTCDDPGVVRDVDLPADLHQGAPHAPVTSNI